MNMFGQRLKATNTDWRRRDVTATLSPLTVTNVPTSVMKQTGAQSESKPKTQITKLMGIATLQNGGQNGCSGVRKPIVRVRIRIGIRVRVRVMVSLVLE